jgi:hypothetical protein
MDSLEIENALAGPLGIRMGTRGDVNDADFIHANQKKYLIKALTKILPKLSKRAEKSPESEWKAWIEDHLRGLDDLKDQLQKDHDNSTGPCLFLLWTACAVALGSIHQALRAQGF